MYDESSPYDTRWPRPGPVMVVVAALAGLLAGSILGMAAGAFSGPSSQAQASTKTTVAVASTRPRVFFTVQLVSVLNTRPRPDARVAQLRGEGLTVDVLNSSNYQGFNPGYWVIYSGTFTTRVEAAAHQREIINAHLDVGGGLVKGPITQG